jgi:Ca-activated chloride channel homolog
MRVGFLIYKCLIIMAALVSVAWLDPFRDAVTKGNEEYGLKKYNSAKRYYRNASEYAPGENDRRKLSFNEGDADYMLEDYDNAASGFQQAVQSDERDVQKRALFNIGNSFLKQGKYPEAIQAYMSALKIDPGYDKPKKNIEYLLNRMNDRNKKKDGKNGGDDKNKKDASQNRQKGDGSDRDAAKKKNNAAKMNQEQIKNILRSMQQNPVQRRKGDSNERRKLEKYW